MKFSLIFASAILLASCCRQRSELKPVAESDSLGSIEEKCSYAFEIGFGDGKSAALVNFEWPPGTPEIVKESYNSGRIIGGKLFLNK